MGRGNGFYLRPHYPVNVFSQPRKGRTIPYSFGPSVMAVLYNEIRKISEEHEIPYPEKDLPSYKLLLHTLSVPDLQAQMFQLPEFGQDSLLNVFMGHLSQTIKNSVASEIRPGFIFCI